MTSVGNGQRRQVPEACIARLSLYLRELTRLGSKHVGFVSSRLLAAQLGVTDAQVRRDLSYFGQFGTSGRGYEVRRLHDRLTSILGVSGRTWNVALAGVGNLGSALLAYRGFQARGFLFRVVATRIRRESAVRCKAWRSHPPAGWPSWPRSTTFTSG